MTPADAVKFSEQFRKECAKEEITFSSRMLDQGGKLKEIEILIKIKVN